MRSSVRTAWCSSPVRPASGKTVSLYTCLNILNQPGHQHLDGRGPGRNPARRRQPGQHERQGRADVRRGAEGLPAPGPGHHHGRRNPRPRDGRHLDQGRADRPHGVLDAAHQRRADDADAPDEHGRAAVQHRVVGDPDHRAAPGAQAVHLQGADGHPARGAARAGFSEDELDGIVAAVSRASAATSARVPATRAASASTR